MFVQVCSFLSLLVLQTLVSRDMNVLFDCDNVNLFGGGLQSWDVVYISLVPIKLVCVCMYSTALCAARSFHDINA